MRTTNALDDELVAKAQALTGLHEKSALVREALKALIERESARRLAASAALSLTLSLSDADRPPQIRPPDAGGPQCQFRKGPRRGSRYRCDHDRLTLIGEPRIQAAPRQSVWPSGELGLFL